MLKVSKNSTNVVWSFSNDQLTQDTIDHVTRSDSDAIRLVGQRHQLTELAEKSVSLRERLRGFGKETPIILDSFFESRGTAAITEPKKVAFNEEVRVSLIGGKGDIELRTPSLSALLKQGAPVYFGAGSVIMDPVDVDNESALLRVSQAGMIQPNVEVHCPETKYPASFDEIKDYLHKVVDCGADCVVIPGFEEVEDVAMTKKALKQLSDVCPWLILRINTEKVYRNLKELLPFVRGVLVSRVELAMCIEPARVPIVTKEIMQICSDRARMVFVASDILSSMRFNATPTRAEVSDIANACMDGADCVVLSKELSMGRYANRGLVLAKKAIHDIESQKRQLPLNWEKQALEITHTLAAVTFAAYKAAQRNRAKAIVCLTKKGNTALLLGSFRTDIPIIAVTMSENVLRRLRLIRGVHAVLVGEDLDIEHVLPRINDKIVRDTWLSAGDKIVFVSVSLSSLGEHASNLFTVQTLT